MKSSQQRSYAPLHILVNVRTSSVEGKMELGAPPERLNALCSHWCLAESISSRDAGAVQTSSYRLLKCNNRAMRSWWQQRLCFLYRLSFALTLSLVETFLLSRLRDPYALRSLLDMCSDHDKFDETMRPKSRWLFAKPIDTVQSLYSGCSPENITSLVLLWWNSILLASDQFSRFARDRWRDAPAGTLTSKSLIASARSFMYTKRKSGPNLEPWGTPMVTFGLMTWRRWFEQIVFDRISSFRLFWAIDNWLLELDVLLLVWNDPLCRRLFQV